MEAERDQILKQPNKTTKACRLESTASDTNKCLDKVVSRCVACIHCFCENDCKVEVVHVLSGISFVITVLVAWNPGTIL